MTRCMVIGFDSDEYSTELEESILKGDKTENVADCFSEAIFVGIFDLDLDSINTDEFFDDMKAIDSFDDIPSVLIAIPVEKVFKYYLEFRKDEK